MHRILLPAFVLLSSCIGTDIIDDEVPATITITNQVESIEVGTSYSFMAEYRNNIGVAEEVGLTWTSTMPEIIAISNDGVAEALAPGQTTIMVNAPDATIAFTVSAGDSTSLAVTERTAALRTVSSYPLSGTAVLEMEDEILRLRLENDFTTTSALPGLYVYLTNNPRSTANAIELGRVEQFTGEQSYNVPAGTNLFDYQYVLFFCKPFVVPVGNGELEP